MSLENRRGRTNMDVVEFLSEIAIIFGLAILAIYVCYRLKIPSIVGFLLTGIIAGPYGLNVIRGVENVNFLAEIGIIFLVFSIGMQFSFKTLYAMKRSVLIGGTLQVLLTIAAVAFAVSFAGIPIAAAIFFGFLVCHSSTTITFKIFQERGEVVSPHGESTLAISLFQDLMSIPMLLAIPLLAGAGRDLDMALLLLVAKVVAVILFALVVARFVVPGMMNKIASTRSPELFLMGIIAICFAVAWVSNAAGLSLALGAFLAGLSLSESEYFYQAFATVLPFRDFFTSFFFVSIGMLFNVGFFLANPVFIVALAAGILLTKTVLAGASALVLGRSFRTSLLIGFALSNIGEFAFILTGAGAAAGLFPGDTYPIFLAVTVISMASAPFLIRAGPSIADHILALPLPNRLRSGIYGVENTEHSGSQEPVALKDHLIVVGYGFTGRNVAAAAKTAGIPYVAIDSNPMTVRSEKEKGTPIFYGDATQETVLAHAGIAGAKVLMISIPDPNATAGIIAMARAANPQIYLIARSRFIHEIERFRRIGADEVIPDEYQTAIEFIFRILARYLVPRDEIDRFIDGIRAESYAMLRGHAQHTTTIGEIGQELAGLDIQPFRIQDASLAAGQSLAGVNLRNRFGVTILAIRRSSGELVLPRGEDRLLPGDLAIAIGRTADLGEARREFARPEDRAAEVSLKKTETAR